MSMPTMKLSEIRQMPTVRDHVHESVYRAHHILDKVVELLKDETPTKVIVEIVEDLRKQTPEQAKENCRGGVDNLPKRHNEGYVVIDIDTVAENVRSKEETERNAKELSKLEGKRKVAAKITWAEVT